MLRRVLHAANAIVLGHTIVRLGSLVLVPLFLRYWSASLYGEYLTLFAAVSYLAGLDVGMQQAAVNRLTQAYAKKDFAEYRRVQHTALAFYLVLATGITLVAAGLAWFLPVQHWIGLRSTKPAIASLVMILLATYVMWGMPMRLITAIYQTMGNLARSQWIANTQQVLVVVLSALVLVAGGGMLSIALLQLLTVGLTLLFVLIDVRLRFPALFPGLTQGKLSVLKNLVHPSMLFALLLAGNLIAYQGSILLVSAVLGGVAVVVLSLSKSIIDVIRQGLYSISLALCPDFARMEALGELDKLRMVHRLTVAVTATATLAIVAVIWYEGPQMLTVWTRGRIQPDVVLLRLFLVLLALQTPWAASSTVATATNRHHVQAVGYFIAAVAGITTAAALIHQLGAWAIPLGLIFGEAIGCYHFVIKATCQIIGESYAGFALRFWIGFGVVAAAVLTVAWLIHSAMPGPMLVRWMVMSLSTTAIATAAAWIVWLTPEDRTLLRPKLRPMLRLSEAKL
jgi:O-antigen/teichoic acid export membrane protein